MVGVLDRRSRPLRATIPRASVASRFEHIGTVDGAAAAAAALLRIGPFGLRHSVESRGGSASFSLNSPYSGAGGMTGTVNESGSESFSYNYTGTPILGADGEWSWSGGSGTAGGSGNATWTKAGSGPYSRTEGYGESSYPIHGTKTEYVAESASYSYSTTAFVVGDVWIVSGSGNNAAQGVSTTGYSGSGSYSSTTTSGGSTVTLDNTTSESGGATESYQASLNFTLSDGLWEATNGSASSYQGWTSNLGQTSTRGETENSNWGDPSNGGNRSAMSLLCRTAQGTSAFGRTETYTWNPGAASGSGSGSGSGSASGSASPWQFTGATETAGAGLSLSLNYAYSGSGASWHLDDEGPEISASYADWHSTRLITQSSLSAFGRTLNTAPGSGGEFETTGTETHAVAASGSADATGDSQWDGMWCWDGITWGRSEASGSTYRETTHDDYDYGYSRAITYHADGTSTSSGGPSNDVSGTLSSSSEGWWEWSEWWTEGSGSGSGSGGGGSSSSNGSSSGSWSQSYSHTVGYPGFYEGAYYGSSPEWGGGDPGDLLEYIGDGFTEGGGGYGYFFWAMGEPGGGMMMALAQDPGTSALDADGLAVKAGADEAAGPESAHRVDSRSESLGDDSGATVTMQAGGNKYEPPSLWEGAKWFAANFWGGAWIWRGIRNAPENARQAGDRVGEAYVDFTEGWDVDRQAQRRQVDKVREGNANALRPAQAPGESTTRIMQNIGEAGLQVQAASASFAAASGDVHHAISRRVHRAAQKHPKLRGEYKYRDPSLTARAIDKAAHNGWPTWHRKLDAEVAAWIGRNPSATKQEFEAWLRWRYDQPDLKAKFPDGL